MEAHHTDHVPYLLREHLAELGLEDLLSLCIWWVHDFRLLGDAQQPLRKLNLVS